MARFINISSLPLTKSAQRNPSSSHKSGVFRHAHCKARSALSTFFRSSEFVSVILLPAVFTALSRSAKACRISGMLFQFGRASAASMVRTPCLRNRPQEFRREAVYSLRQTYSSSSQTAMHRWQLAGRRLCAAANYQRRRSGCHFRPDLGERLNPGD